MDEITEIKAMNCQQCSPRDTNPTRAQQRVECIADRTKPGNYMIFSEAPPCEIHVNLLQKVVIRAVIYQSVVDVRYQVIRAHNTAPGRLKFKKASMVVAATIALPFPLQHFR